MKPLVAAAVILVALAAGAQAQTPEIDALRTRAAQGDARAQFDLGLRYATGEGVPQDDAEAARWYRLAAEQGNVTAQVNLGVMYFNGAGVPQDDAEAVRWYRLAAGQGHVTAQHNLRGSYANGAGVPQDDAEAVRWFRLAAEQGHAGAQFNLGVMYRTGEGVSQDYAEAVRWYRLAAEQGHAGGQSWAVLRRPRRSACRCQSYRWLAGGSTAPRVSHAGGRRPTVRWRRVEALFRLQSEGAAL